MKRGELMGFNGCLGYDYHQEDKSISINDEEAEIVRWIFERYNQGYGAYTIAKDLRRLSKKNKKVEIKWTDSGVSGIVKMKNRNIPALIENWNYVNNKQMTIFDLDKILIYTNILEVQSLLIFYKDNWKVIRELQELNIRVISV